VCGVKRCVRNKEAYAELRCVCEVNRRVLNKEACPE